MRLIPLLVSIVLLTGCLGDGHGIRIAEDGRLRPQTPPVVQEDTAAHIAASLQPQLGPGWTVEVVLDPLPEWEVVEVDEFGWKHLTCTVTCRGVGEPPVGMSAAEIEAEVTRYLAPKVVRPAASNLRVAVRFIAPQPATAVASQSSIPASPQARPAAGPRQYTIQGGDTLALISEVFYGSPDHWRKLIDANPGLAPGSLSAGQVITIP